MTGPAPGNPRGVADDTADLEDALLRDLFPLRDRLRDEWFARELYRALTSTAWRKRDGPDGHLSLSWTRAESIVNELRERDGEAPLELAQTGGEGEVSPMLAEELAGLGWTSASLDTGRHDDAHVDDDAPTPPASRDRGEAPEWERRAHEEAERNR